MGTFGAAMGLQALAGLSSYESQKQNAANQIAYLNAEGNAALTSMNYSLQNLELQRQQAYDNTVQALMSAQKQGVQQVSAVQAAVNEAGDSRGGRRLVNDTQGLLDQAMTNLKGQYEDTSNTIDQNKWLTWENTNMTLKNINNVQVSMPSIMSTMLSTGSQMLGTYSAFKGIDSMRKAAGISTGGTTPFTMEIPRLNLSGIKIGSSTYVGG